jgi:hypothetical protein
MRKKRLCDYGMRAALLHSPLLFPHSHPPRMHPAQVLAAVNDFTRAGAVLMVLDPATHTSTELATPFSTYGR